MSQPLLDSNRKHSTLTRTVTKDPVSSIDGETGAALPFVAVILVLLLGMSAFAVDLGWLYLSAARVQRAADAASLAGVVFLLGDVANVTASAIDGASANGFDVGTVNGTPVGGGGPDELAWRQLSDNRLEVTFATDVPTFFMKLFGFESFGITRVSTAEYVKPVPIGSPDDHFGDGSNHFWASINGRWTAHMHGDPYQTKCDWATDLSDSDCVDSSPASQAANFPGAIIRPGDVDSDSDEDNPQFRGDGYHYGIEISTGRNSLLVELYDAAFRKSCGSGTGDCDNLSFSPEPPAGGTIGPTTRYRLYAPDGTPLNPRDNTVLLCDQTFASTTAGLASWEPLCSIPNPAAGIHVLKVTTSDGSGNNQYGVRVSTQGPGTNDPNVYGINEISIYTNQDSTTATLFLAELDPIHAGKILELNFYDAGEDDGPASYTVEQPDGSTATCEWESEDGGSGGPGSCVIQTSNSAGPLFNSQWLTALIDIPDAYDCDITEPLDCWWKMRIVNNQPHDRTTWTARVIGWRGTIDYSDDAVFRIEPPVPVSA